MTAPHCFIRSWLRNRCWLLVTSPDRSWSERTRPLMTAHDRSWQRLASWRLVTADELWLLTAHASQRPHTHAHVRTRTHTTCMHAHHHTNARTHTHTQTQMHIFLFVHVCVCVCGVGVGCSILKFLRDSQLTIKTLKPTWIKHHWNLEINTDTTKIT